MVGALLTGKPLSTACFYSPSLQAWIDGLVAADKIDRVVVFGSAMAPYLVGSRTFSPKHVIFDMVDIDSDKWSQYSRDTKGVMRWLYKREAEKLFQVERRRPKRSAQHYWYLHTKLKHLRASLLKPGRICARPRTAWIVISLLPTLRTQIPFWARNVRS